MMLREPQTARSLSTNGTDRVFLPGIFDTDNFWWGAELFEFTVSLINNHTDGWYDNVLDDGTVLEYLIADGGCDRTIAMRAYWDLRTQNGEVAPHGIVGCRCSGASVAVASVAGLEHVPQMSFSSTSMHLSDTEEFPNFFRVVDAKEAHALKSLYRSMGWDRVTVLQTDTQWARDMATSFQQIWVGQHNDASGSWEGEIPHSHTIVLNDDGTVNEESVLQALRGIPTDDPTENSRIILLAAHDQHVHPIWSIAQNIAFQPDTVWSGVDVNTWLNQVTVSSEFRANFIGIVPFSDNNSDIYHDYMARLREWKKEHGKVQWDDLPEHYSFYQVDAILSMAMALSNVTKDQRRNGTAVAEALYNTSYTGISGPVAFTNTGDRSEPQYSVYQYYESTWQNVGKTGTSVGSTSITFDALCFEGLPCGTIPDDSYPVPDESSDTGMNTAAIVVIVIVGFLFLFVVGLYLRMKRKKNKYKNILQETKKIDSDLADLDKQVENAKKKQAQLILERAQLQGVPDTWTHTGEVAVEVLPEDPQYWDVLDRMRTTMSDVHISKLWRIENTPLWSFYCFHRDRIIKQTNKQDIGEREVWHGTSSLEPSVVYKDEQDGFMMQFAAQGFWGRGIYFAQNASYSHHYAHKPSMSSFQSSAKGLRGSARVEEREMFLSKLLVGTEVKLERDNSLIVPPLNPSTNNKYRYHTVTGSTGGSQVWIVYENGRAYPEYLVRYYRGTRDQVLSPYKTRQESMKKSASQQRFAKTVDDAEAGTDTSPTDDGSDILHTTKGVWEWVDNFGNWIPFDDQHQVTLEQCYSDLKNTKSTDPKVTIQTDEWRYEVDVNTMTQTNLDHSAHRVRDVRRREERSSFRVW